MHKLLESKAAAWCAFILVFVLVILSLTMLRSWKEQWWTLLDEFFAFMMVFSQLVSVYMRKMNPVVGQKLSVMAAVFGGLMIISFFVEYFMMN
ncbi:MAG: hypothetical protein K2J82_12460 [Muribaculaceae bacterium]|nr:hypothetical protein [Muribaculaceae bacterium]MDE6755404.1 hypothetical protein [Muribaculaceae bacterium]